MYFADNISYIRVVGTKCRRVCRSCFETGVRLVVNPSILRDVQTGVHKMTSPKSKAISVFDLQSFSAYLKRNISREYRGVPIA